MVELMEFLKTHDLESVTIETELNELDLNFGKLARNRTQIKQYLEKIKAALSKFTTDQIDDTIKTLDDQLAKAVSMISKAKLIEEDLDRRIRELQGLIIMYKEKMEKEELDRVANLLEELLKKMKLNIL